MIPKMRGSINSTAICLEESVNVLRDSHRRGHTLCDPTSWPVHKMLVLFLETVIGSFCECTPQCFRHLQTAFGVFNLVKFGCSKEFTIVLYLHRIMGIGNRV